MKKFLVLCTLGVLLFNVTTKATAKVGFQTELCKKFVDMPAIVEPFFLLETPTVKVPVFNKAVTNVYKPQAITAVANAPPYGLRFWRH